MCVCLHVRLTVEDQSIRLKRQAIKGDSASSLLHTQQLSVHTHTQAQFSRCDDTKKESGTGGHLTRSRRTLLSGVVALERDTSPQPIRLLSSRPSKSQLVINAVGKLRPRGHLWPDELWTDELLNPHEFLLPIFIIISKLWGSYCVSCMNCSHYCEDINQPLNGAQEDAEVLPVLQSPVPSKSLS